MFFLQTDQVITGAVNEASKLAEQVASGNTEAMSSLVQSGISWGVEIGKSLLMAIAIFVVGRFFISLVKKLMNKMMTQRHIEPTIQTFLRSFVSILLTILLIISVVSALGVNTTSFAALLASAGVAVGMALSGNLQNFAGGLIILLFKPFRVGDYVEAQGVSGSVKEIQIFHTILTTPDNKEIHVPNGSLSSGAITNYSSNSLRRVDFTFGVEYGEDCQKVRNILLTLFTSDKRILQDPAPFVGLGALSDSSVDFTVRVWVNSADYWDVFFQTQEAVYNEFNKQGVGFPFPQVTVHQA